METETNRLSLCGVIETEPTLDHQILGERFFCLNLRVPRLSGAWDVLPVTVPERLMNSHVTAGVLITIEGQLRTYNKVIGSTGRLMLTAFAQRLLPPDETRNSNQIHLSGVLCKPPSYRTTPFGREITDLMLAVNRSFGKSDYIPCIAWGSAARYAFGLRVGDMVETEGRFQSREYQKQLDDGRVMNRMAYEVSLTRLICLTPENR